MNRRNFFGVMAGGAGAVVTGRRHGMSGLTTLHYPQMQTAEQMQEELAHTIAALLERDGGIDTLYGEDLRLMVKSLDVDA